ncbi:MAG: hypothetical protein JSW71_14785 [Gemmatimonadota bacterium]|nr:MAG: hypothetical protein JSW71_14785 [Gemmatimonadota bacterium]
MPILRNTRRGGSNLREYHHVGIPTQTPREGEEYVEQYGMYVVGYDTNPYGIEWLRFEPHSPLPELVQQVPHVAFKVDDLDAELTGNEVLIEPNSPSPGVRVAFIEHNGAPVEFLQFDEESQDSPRSQPD